jgi:hypothetical protein
MLQLHAVYHANVNTTLETVLLEANAIKITVVSYDRKNNELLKKLNSEWNVVNSSRGSLLRYCRKLWS